MYLFDVLPSLRADLLEESPADGLAVAFSFLLSHLPHILKVQFGAQQKEYSLLMDMLLDLSDPEVEFLVAVPPFDGVEEHDCSDALVLGFDDGLEVLLAHLSRSRVTVSQICRLTEFFSLICTSLV